MNLSAHNYRLRAISSVITIKSVTKHRTSKQLMHASFHRLLEVSLMTSVSIKEKAQTTIVFAFESQTSRILDMFSNNLKSRSNNVHEIQHRQYCHQI